MKKKEFSIFRLEILELYWLKESLFDKTGNLLDL